MITKNCAIYQGIKISNTLKKTNLLISRTLSGSTNCNELRLFFAMTYPYFNVLHLTIYTKINVGFDVLLGRDSYPLPTRRRADVVRVKP